MAALKSALAQCADVSGAIGTGGGGGGDATSLRMQLNMARGVEFAARVSRMASLLADKQKELDEAEVGSAHSCFKVPEVFLTTTGLIPSTQTHHERPAYASLNLHGAPAALC